ncbi:MAG: hypothetical protein K0S41_2943 [Anaerocolumna sp.]|jgi:hypothetical protein|nr:hypothetical protein [Anaerocolumna sp.]
MKNKELRKIIINDMCFLFFFIIGMIEVTLGAKIIYIILFIFMVILNYFDIKKLKKNETNKK